MKLQTQFTVPHKQLRDLDYVKEIEILEETLKKKCIDYPTQEDCSFIFPSYLILLFEVIPSLRKP